MVAVSPTASVSVVAAGDGHAAAMAEFYQAVGWDREATAERVRGARTTAAATNPVAPGQAPPTFIFLAGDRVLGHVTTVPVRLRTRGLERPGYWLKGLMVVPEHRNGPVGMLLLKEAVRQLGVAPLMAMVVQAAPRRLFAAIGFADLGAIPNYLRVLRPGRLLARLDPDALAVPAARTLRAGIRAAQRTGVAAAAGALASGACAIWAALLGGRRRPADVRISSELDLPACDLLWRRVGEQLAAAPSRDGAFLRWRYAATDTGPYRFVEAREGGALVGVAVVRAPRGESDPRLRGLRLASLSDLLYAPDHRAVGLALLAGAEREARRRDADALLCTASHRSLTSRLRARAFVPVGGTVHFLFRDPNGLPDPAKLADWWLTRGDSNADEAL